MKIKTLYFPTNLDVFPHVFLKMEFTGRKPKEKKKGPSLIIYLPLPSSEFFQKVFQMDYITEDIGISGEFAKRNVSSVIDVTGNVLGSRDTKGISNAIDEALSDKGFFETISNIFSTEGTYGAVKTGLERQLTGGRSTAVKSVVQGFGYGSAPNITQIFQDMNLRDGIVLSWTLSPKNYKDGTAIESIYKEIAKIALPYLREEHLSKTITPFYTNAFGENVEDPAFHAGMTSLGSDGYNLSGFAQDDAKRKAMFEQDVIPKNEIYNQAAFLNAKQYYSTTYELPYSVALKVMKTKDPNSGERGPGKKDEIEEATELVSFKIPFVIRNIAMEFNKTDGTNSAIPFIKYLNPKSNEAEYFSQAYEIYMTVGEETVQTANDIVDHYQEIQKSTQ